jgi:hypothetical protein
MGCTPVLRQETQQQATSRKQPARKLRNQREHQTVRPDLHRIPRGRSGFRPAVRDSGRRGGLTPANRLNWHASPTQAKQQQAASNKPQAKSKKGAYLSVRLLLVAVGLVPIPQGGTTMASLMLQRVTAFPLHLCTVWSSWTDFFSRSVVSGQWPLASVTEDAKARRIEVFSPECTLWTLWTVRSLWSLWTLWTVFFKFSDQWPVVSG